MKLTLAAVAAKLVEKQVYFEYGLEGIGVFESIHCPFAHAYTYLDDTVHFTDSSSNEVSNEKLITFFLY